MSISTKTRLAGALALALFANTDSAFAQQPPAPAPAPAAAAAPVPVITDTQMALGRQIVTGSGLSRSYEGVVAQMMAQINSTITRTRPELGPDLKVVLEGLVTEFSPKTSEMVDTSARIFASKMTEAEMKDVAAFFASASGKKYVAIQPVALDEIVVSMDDWRQKMSGDISERIRAEMKKKGHNL